MLNGNHCILQLARKEFDKRGEEIREALLAYKIADDKIKPVVNFCIETLIHNRQMKTHRIVRKAAERFKLQKLQK